MICEVTESQFYMWRAIFALAHADKIVTPEELTYMAMVMEGLPFTEEQKEVLRDDVIHAKCVDTLFLKVGEILDQAIFFKFARELVHIDGAFVSEEQAAMLRVEQFHLMNVDVDELVGKISMDFQDEDENTCHEVKKAIHSCRDEFLARLGAMKGSFDE